MELLNKYIEKRYYRWLDYAAYHCSYHGLKDEAVDVLNEVLVMLIEKYNANEAYIMRLYESKKGKYRELDFFVLQMIKLNVISPTSPYRHKYKSLPEDDNIELSSIDIADEQDDEIDHAGEILKKMHVIRDILDNLNLSDSAKKIFTYKFFEGESYSDWTGPEDKKYLYDTFRRVMQMIKDKIKGNSLF